MKVYHLTIVYNEKTEEIEYIQEELQGETESLLTEFAEIDLQGYFDEEDSDFIKGCYIIGKA